MKKLVDDLHNKFKDIPNTGFIDIWLQRISIALGIRLNYKDQLTHAALAKVKMSDIWNCDWLQTDAVKTLNAMTISNLKDEVAAKRISPVISREEVELFKLSYD